MPLVSASVLDADFSDAKKLFQALERGGADFIHWDIMDGKYVPNKTFESSFVDSLRGKTRLPFDVHLMVNEPEKYLDGFSGCADLITFHPECSKNPGKLIDAIHAKGIKAGVCVNNRVPASCMFPFLGKVDLVLVMGVEAGFGGQKFNSLAPGKVLALKKEIVKKKLNCLISVDGGINQETGRQCVEAGADILVAGNFLIKASDIAKAIKQLKEC